MTLNPFHRENMPLFHTNGPSTEREAIGRHEASGRAASNRATVLMMVRRWPGWTSAELDNVAGAGMDVHEVRRRLTDLLNRGEVMQDCKRKCEIAKTLAVTWWPVGETK